jgi:choline dehydrogenase
MLDARGLACSHAWETEREDRSQLRARILGGCSAHNACVALEGAPADYDEWGHGWDDDAIRPVPRAGAARVARAAILHPVNAVGAIRWNTAFAYVDPARERPNLTILADTLVDHVLLAGDRAVGSWVSCPQTCCEHG